MITINANGSTVFSTIKGHEYVAAAQGVFSAGALALEFSLDGGTAWSAITDSNGAVSWTSANSCAFLAPGTLARFTLSGAGSPVITAEVSAR